MLLSERELQISNDHEGIIEVAANLAVGTPAAQAELPLEIDRKARAHDARHGQRLRTEVEHPEQIARGLTAE